MSLTKIAEDMREAEAVMAEAADEIVRLRAENEDLANALRGMVGLAELLRGRGDLPADVVNALTKGCIHENHRLQDARAVLARLEAA